LKIETVGDDIVGQTQHITMMREFDKHTRDFTKEVTEVFPQQTLDTIFQCPVGERVNVKDIKQFSGAGLNHECIMIALGYLVKVIVVDEDTPGASKGEGEGKFDVGNDY
jgi:hypothetical protein